MGKRRSEDTRCLVDSEGKVKVLSVAEHGVDGTRKSVPTWMSELHNREREKRKQF